MKRTLPLLAALFFAPWAEISVRAAIPAPAAGRIDIRDYGAIGDGATVNTAAIQAAIDATTERGGEVLVTGGQFVTGTIYLKSLVTLHVATGAALLGSTRIADYTTDTHHNQYKKEPHMDRCLIFARGARQIGITGGGVIDGRGGSETFPNRDDPKKNRPMLIRFVECESIRVRDITLRNPASWTSAWLYCHDIAIDGITISSRANNNGDGLDFDGCTAVRVSNSAFDTSDDSICLQTSRPDRPCRDVTIGNCLFVSKWAGIRIGLLSRGDFANVTVTNCIFRDISDSGLKIQMCEGGEMRNMLFTNLVMENVPRPIFLTFVQQRAAADAPPGLAPMKALRDLTFSNLLIDSGACGKDSAIILVGLPGHPIQNIVLDNLRFRSGGGGTTAEATPRALPDLTLERIGDHWPEYYSFKRTVPTHGIYAAHVQGLTLRHCILETRVPDARPAIVCADVKELDISDVVVAAAPSAEALLGVAHSSGRVRDLRDRGAERRLVESIESDVQIANPKNL